MQQTIATHDGKFHADDVFAVATLRLLNANSAVTRTRDSKVLEASNIVVDVGGVYDESLGRFDHHQKGGAGMRANSVPYASFGLVWKAFGQKLCSDKSVANRIDDVLVVPIDANDNGVDLSSPTIDGVSSYELSDAIRAFVPTWQEGFEPLDSSFDEAVVFAKRIIQREIVKAEAFVAGQRMVETAYENSADKRLIVLDEDYSWKGILSGFPEPLYVVHPQNDTWRIYSVRDNPHVFANRKDLPESWAGLRDEPLAKVTGIQDAVFCHRNRFMAVAKSKEGALELAKQALNS